MEQGQFLELVKSFQRNEILEKEVYERIAKSVRNEEDRRTLEKIASEEVSHYNIWKSYTKCDVSPSRWKVSWYVLLAKLFGYTFTIKLMENQQSSFQSGKAGDWIDNGELIAELERSIPNVDSIVTEEVEHEQELIGMIDEEKLQYVGSMVLGLNDALVEFSGSLAGWTFAMQSNRLISLAGLITGVAATLSMASSEYLSAKSDHHPDPLKSSTYTGIAYLLTVIVLLLPYLLLPDRLYLPALIIMLILVISIIAGFNYYISVAKNEVFSKKFREMAIVSLSVAGISFLIGLLVKKFLGIDL